MRVNNINLAGRLAVPNFTRAIQVVSDTNRGGDDGKIDNSTMSVVRVLQNKPTTYSADVSRKINTFLRAQIGDISKSRVYPRKINGKVYIYTGEEAKTARAIDVEAKRKMESGLDIENTLKERNKKLLALVEDGLLDDNGNSKPATQITLDFAQGGKLNSIEYFCMKFDDEAQDAENIEEKKLTL